MKRFAVIGHPIEHSLSPLMHNTAFKELGLECVYEKIDVIESSLGEYVGKLVDGEYDGLNVTIPYKQRVIEHCTNLSTEVELIGAANTLKRGGGGVTAFNTDGLGCVKALGEEGIRLRGKNLLVIGAGGASRAITVQAALEGTSSIIIANRTVGKAESLAREISGRINVDVGAIGLDALGSVIDDVDVLINATSVGMKPHDDETPVPEELLRQGLSVMDIVYNPLKTRLLEDAENAGCETIDGAGMLVHQGAESLRIWLGIHPPVSKMRSAVVKELQGLSE